MPATFPEALLWYFDLNDTLLITLFVLIIELLVIFISNIFIVQNSSKLEEIMLHS